MSTKVQLARLEERQKALKREVDLRSQLSEMAIRKSETAMLERMESSNNKFGLLKEQAGDFATKADLGNISKLVYMGMGGLLALQIILQLVRLYYK